MNRDHKENKTNSEDREDLLKRIEILEKDIAEIWWRLLPAAARQMYQAAIQNPNVVRIVTKEVHQISVDPSTVINASDKIVLRTKVCNNMNHSVVTGQ